MKIFLVPLSILLLQLTSLSFQRSTTASADTTDITIHPAVEITSHSSIGSLDVCDYKEPEEWFSRINNEPSMANPVMTFRYCSYTRNWKSSNKGACQTCYASYCYDNYYMSVTFPENDTLTCGKTFTRKIKDGEVFRAFYDEMRPSNDPKPYNAAVGWSDEGTVCFYHMQGESSLGARQKCTSSSYPSEQCEVSCFGISDDSEEKHVLSLASYDNGKEPWWVVEISFGKEGSSGGKFSSGNRKGGKVTLWSLCILTLLFVAL